MLVLDLCVLMNGSIRNCYNVPDLRDEPGEIQSRVFDKGEFERMRCFQAFFHRKALIDGLASGIMMNSLSCAAVVSQPSVYMRTHPSMRPLSLTPHTH